MHLNALLIRLGIWVRHGAQGQRKTGYTWASRLTDAQLWRLHDQAKANWKNRLAKIHPDHGGTHEEAAVLNAFWARAKVLFARLGIKE